MNKEQELLYIIEDKILNVAYLFNEVTTSDLQAITNVTAQEIIKIIREG